MFRDKPKSKCNICFTGFFKNVKFNRCILMFIAFVKLKSDGFQFVSKSGILPNSEINPNNSALPSVITLA